MTLVKMERSLSSMSLMAAVRLRKRNLVSQLATHHDDLHQRSQQGYTALHHCSIYNDVETARILIEHGADANARDNHLRSPLQLAMTAESVDVALLLVQWGCSTRVSVESVLRMAKRAEEFPGIHALLNKLATELKGSYLEFLPIHRAIVDYSPHVLDLLLKAGFNANAKDEYGISALYYCIVYRRREHLETLLQCGADVNYVVAPKTERRLCESINLQQMVSSLLGGCVTTPIRTAARFLGDVDSMKLLLKYGANPNYVFPEDGGTLLMGLCAPGYLDLAKTLVYGGARINHRNAKGFSPLYWAVRCDNPGLVRYMLEHGGDVNIADKEGPTLLHLAVMNGHQEVAEVLLEFGADFDRRTGEGQTAVELALEYEHKNTACMLRRSAEDEEDGEEEDEEEDEEDDEEDEASYDEGRDNRVIEYHFHHGRKGFYD